MFQLMWTQRGCSKKNQKSKIKITRLPTPMMPLGIGGQANQNVKITLDDGGRKSDEKDLASDIKHPTSDNLWILHCHFAFCTLNFAFGQVRTLHLKKFNLKLISWIKKGKEVAIFQIRKVGDPALREKAQPVKEIDSEIKDLVKNLEKTMRETEGVGIAATQVGFLKRVFVCDVGGGLIVCINPRVLSQEGKAVREEGCLSVPGARIPIKRAEKIRLRALDLQGNEVELNLEGLPARVIQHEIDHLNGILIIDRASRRERAKALKKLSEETQLDY